MIDMDEADTAYVVGMGDSRDEGEVVRSQYRWTVRFAGRERRARMFRRNERKPYGDEVLVRVVLPACTACGSRSIDRADAVASEGSTSTYGR